MSAACTRATGALQRATRRMHLLRSLHTQCTRCPAVITTANSTPAEASQTGAATAVRPTTGPLIRTEVEAELDKDLRLLFDRDAGSSRHASASLGQNTVGFLHTGLFGDERLATADGFRLLAEEGLARSARLVTLLREAREETALREAVRRLDELSDTLCSVLDLAEFVRHVHPDPRYIEEAQRAYERLFSFMNTLNTDIGLYETLRICLSHPTVAKQLDEEERRVAELFLRDFERSGIQLSAQSRHQFVTLSDRILSLSKEFMTRAGPEVPFVDVHADNYAQNAGVRVRGASRVSTGVRLPTTETAVRTVLRYYEDDAVREKMYRASHVVSDQEVQVLDELLYTRAKLAKLVGWESYADMALDGKMAGSAASVQSFLEGLAWQHLPKATEDLRQLQRAKQQHLGLTDSPILHAWDRDFYTQQLRRQFAIQKEAFSDDAQFCAYTSVGRCIQGISRILSRLYGIKLEPSAAAPGETWHPTVQKLAVIDEYRGRIGTIYCDLSDRPGKPSGAAHYTVRCARRIWPDELRDPVGPPEFYSTNAEGQQRQLPVVVLVCGFAHDTEGLSLRELETLFHEMGHAVHSMLGQTDFHNVAGTRCVTDFVEFPSILFERFAADPRVLDLFARHHRTGERLPAGMLRQQLRQRRHLSSLDQHHQLLLAYVDQLFHSSPQIHTAMRSSTGNSSSSSISDRLLAEAEHNALYSMMPHVPDARWQMEFTHLISYGASYYTYLLGRALAGQAWRQLFADDPLSRTAGEHLRSSVLRWGGARDPWRCMGELLEDELIREGGATGMKRVGEFGLDAKGGVAAH